MINDPTVLQEPRLRSLPAPARGSAWRLEVGLALLAVLVGTWLRSTRYFVSPISLWLDEAEWAVRLIEGPLLEQAIRPLGFVWFTRALAQAFGASEPVVRFGAYFFGILAIGVFYSCARALFRRAVTRLILVWAFALHPLLIDFSREFKPYSVEVFCHALLVLTTWSALVHKRSRLRFACAVVAPVCAFPFAYNVVFTYPAIFGLLGWEAWRERRFARLSWVVLAAAVAGGAALGLQLGILSNVDESAYGARYWGRKYDVFLMPDRQIYEGAQPRLALVWVLSKISEFFTGPGHVPSGWHLPAAGHSSGLWPQVYAWAWGAVALSGVVVWLRSNPRALLLAVCPLLCVGVFNALGKWPLGFFRVNLFSLVYTLLLAGAALDWFVEVAARRTGWGSGWRSGIVPCTLAAALLLPRLGFAAPVRAVKETRPWMGHSEFRRALSVLSEHKTARRAPLLLDYYSFNTLPYYERLHPTGAGAFVRRAYGVKLVANLDFLKAALARTRGTSWVLVSRWDHVAPAHELTREACRSLQSFELGPHHLLVRCER